MLIVRTIILLMAGSMQVAAMGDIVHVGFNAELAETSDILGAPPELSGSFCFDDADLLSATSDIVGPYVQTELIEFTLVTPQGSVDANSGQVIQFGYSQPGIFNVISGIYSVQVGAVSYPPPKDSLLRIDYGDRHYFHIDVPRVPMPIANIKFVYGQNEELPPSPTLLPPSLHKLVEAELAVASSVVLQNLFGLTDELVHYRVTSIYAIPEASSLVLLAVALSGTALIPHRRLPRLKKRFSSASLR